MKVNFHINKDDNLKAYVLTPGPFAQRLPFCIYSSGHFHAAKPYFTEREGIENRYLLIYTQSGQGYLKYKENEYWLNPNTIAVFNSGSYQYYSTASEIPWEFKWIYFYGSAVKEYDELINAGKLSVTSIFETESIDGFIDEVFICMKNNGLFNDVKICNFISNLLTELLLQKNQNYNTGKSLQHKSDIDNAIGFIHGNYDKSILVDDIISRLHISKFHFLRLFKTHTGFSLYEYLCNYRINKAKELLRTTGRSVSEIALLVGFNNANNFTRYFKSATGMTPGNYRKFLLY